jgi:hypothetical protein
LNSEDAVIVMWQKYTISRNHMHYSCLIIFFLYSKRLNCHLIHLVFFKVGYFHFLSTSCKCNIYNFIWYWNKTDPRQYSWNIVEGGIKHHKSKLKYIYYLNVIYMTCNSFHYRVGSLTISCRIWTQANHPSLAVLERSPS